MKKKFIICSCCATLLFAFCIFFVPRQNQKPGGLYTIGIPNGADDFRHTYIIYTDGTYDSLAKILGTDKLCSGTWNLEDGILKFEEFDGEHHYSDGEYVYDSSSDSFSYKHKDTYTIWRNADSGTYDDEKNAFTFEQATGFHAEYWRLSYKKKAIIICSCCAALLLAVCIFFVIRQNKKPYGAYYCHPRRSTYIIYKDGTFDYETNSFKHYMESGTWDLEDGILTFSNSSLENEYNSNTNSFSHYNDRLDEDLIWEKLE